MLRKGSPEPPRPPTQNKTPEGNGWREQEGDTVTEHLVLYAHRTTGYTTLEDEHEDVPTHNPPEIFTSYCSCS